MRQHPAFWQAVALTLLGHGVVLGWLATVQPDPAPYGARLGSAMTFLVRPLQPPLPPGTAPGAPASDIAAALQAAGAAPAEAPRQAPAPVQAAAPGPAAQAEPPALAAAAPPAAVPEPAYLPRGELTVPPRLLGQVDVPFPPDVEGIVDLKVRVTLFIDERGTVQRLRVETPDVHPAFERSIRAAFDKARFSPGELDQVAVRSQVRLEVEFHAPNVRRRS